MTRLLLRCRTSIIRSSALVHVSSSLCMVRIRNVATGLTSSKNLFSPFFCASFSSHCSQSCPHLDMVTDYDDISQAFVQGELLPGDSHNGNVCFPSTGLRRGFSIHLSSPQATLWHAVSRPCVEYDYEHFPGKRRLQNCGFRKEYVASRC